MVRAVMALRKWLPPVIWMALIFGGSTDVLSGEHTSRFVVPLLRWVFGEGSTPEQLEWYHHLIRKAGHVTEYAVLSVLLWLALWKPLLGPEADRNQRRHWFAALVAVLLAVGYAALDEYHQSFTPSRTANWQDVVIDGAGAVFGVTLLAVARLGFGKRTVERSTLAIH